MRADSNASEATDGSEHLAPRASTREPCADLRRLRTCQCGERHGMTGREGIVLRIVVEEPQPIQIMLEFIARPAAPHHQLDAVQDRAGHRQTGKKRDRGAK